MPAKKRRQSPLKSVSPLESACGEIQAHLAQISAILESLSESERNQLFVQLTQPSSPLVILPGCMWKMMIQAAVGFGDKYRARSKCSEVRKARGPALRKAIDGLFDDDYLRSQIWEQMQVKHPDLMRGQGGTMQERSMWLRYKKEGGTHPRSIP